MNHSRKSYIEFLCIQDLKLNSFEKTDVRGQKIRKDLLGKVDFISYVYDNGII